MHRLVFFLAHWTATNSWLALTMGFIVASSGAIDLIETERGAFDILFNSKFALMIAGLQQSVFGLANLLLGSRLVGIGLLGAEHDDHHPTINKVLKGYVENPFLTFVLGLTLLVMVSVQAWQDWVQGGIGQKRSVWYFGLALVALLSVARSAESVLLGLGMIDDGESRGHFSLRIARRLNRLVRKRWLLVTVATICIGLGLAEEFFVVAYAPDTRVLISHHGYLLFALLEVSKLLPIVFPGAVLANEGLKPPK